jgi:hypothetical protein
MVPVDVLQTLLLQLSESNKPKQSQPTLQPKKATKSEIQHNIAKLVNDGISLKSDIDSNLNTMLQNVRHINNVEHVRRHLKEAKHDFGLIAYNTSHNSNSDNFQEYSKQHHKMQLYIDALMLQLQYLTM